MDEAIIITSEQESNTESMKTEKQEKMVEKWGIRRGPHIISKSGGYSSCYHEFGIC